MTGYSPFVVQLGLGGQATTSNARDNYVLRILEPTIVENLSSVPYGCSNEETTSTQELAQLSCCCYEKLLSILMNLFVYG